MGIKDFVNGVLGIDDEYEDEVITEKEIEEEKKKISASSRSGEEIGRAHV